MGNDFIPHIPSIDIKIGGIDILICAYIDVYLSTKQNLVNLVPNAELNTHFLIKFLEYISKRESYYFSSVLPKRKSINRECPYSDPYKKELWELENLKRFTIRDNIKLGHGSDWKHRYYEHHFKTGKIDFINKICLRYCESIIWVLRYYFEGCPSWSWNYPFIHAPFVSDIHKYVKEHNANINSISFKKNSPLTPCQQLVAVLPPESSHILPKKFQKLTTSFNSPIIDLYPTYIKLDMIGCNKYWQCHSLIPNVDINRIRNATKNITLSKKEQQRNILLLS